VKQNVCVAHLNINSLLLKKDQISVLLSSCNIDILCLNETKLDESISDDELLMTNFNIIRRDRTRHGGGIVIYINNTIKYNVVNDLNCENIEVLWLEVILPKLEPFLLCSVYKPPSSNVTYRNCMLENFQNAADINPNVLILGDFNENILSMSTTFVNDICCLIDAKQLVSEATRVTPDTNSLIDLIFTTFYDKHSCTTVSKICLSDHYMVSTNIECNFSNAPHNMINCRSFKNFEEPAFINDLRKELCNVDMSVKMDEMWHEWKAKFINVCDIYAPIRSF
jgi:exonuclease III